MAGSEPCAGDSSEKRTPLTLQQDEYSVDPTPLLLPSTRSSPVCPTMCSFPSQIVCVLHNHDGSSSLESCFPYMLILTLICACKYIPSYFLFHGGCSLHTVTCLSVRTPLIRHLPPPVFSQYWHSLSPDQFAACETKLPSGPSFWLPSRAHPGLTLPCRLRYGSCRCA